MREERYYEAELHRVRGCLLLAGSGAASGEAAASFQKALNVAHSQQAKSLGLRAAHDLAALQAGQGHRRQAHDLLSSRYAGFTEGFETPDLANAKELVHALQ